MKKLILILLSLALASCGNSNSLRGGTEGGDALQYPNPTAIMVEIGPSSSGIFWADSYSTAIWDMLDRSEFKELLEMKVNEHDLEKIHCKRFNELYHYEKIEFFTGFIAAIAEAESDFEVDQMTYNRSDRTMNVGLLQIDPASADRHAGKFFEQKFSHEDLKNPEMNLKVGIMIFKHQLESTNGRLFPESIYYWQVLSGRASRVIKNASANLKLLCEEV